MIDTYIGHTGDAIKLIDEMLEAFEFPSDFDDLLSSGDLEAGLHSIKDALERGII